jgi:HK97 family phage major capsid protein
VRGELGDELFRYMVDHLSDMPPAQRARACWVMNAEWYAECLAMTDQDGHAIWEPPARDATIFGLPFAVTADGGVPHLIAD